MLYAVKRGEKIENRKARKITEDSHSSKDQPANRNRGVFWKNEGEFIRLERHRSRVTGHTEGNDENSKCRPFLLAPVLLERRMVHISCQHEPHDEHYSNCRAPYPSFIGTVEPHNVDVPEQKKPHGYQRRPARMCPERYPSLLLLFGLHAGLPLPASQRIFRDNYGASSAVYRETWYSHYAAGDMVLICSKSTDATLQSCSTAYYNVFPYFPYFPSLQE
mmetsp:Transcript_27707/g.51665  ORF Transcript_27707/g.51665 Transcript_27707/m.51665 type:complete len:219 (-) Transcript_27707:785-1441(-)